MMHTMPRVMRVSGMESESIIARTETTVTTAESICGRLWLIIWRSVSMSFV